MAEQKKKKKFPWGGVIYFAACLLIGAVIGVVLGVSDVDVKVDPVLFIVIMATFIVSLYVHIIVHEAGHALFGMMTGYKFLSYRVGSLMWEKGADGKVRLSRFSLAGTGGQCLMSPPEYNGGDFPYVWYNLGGVAVNFLLSVLAGVALMIFPVGKWVSVALWMLLLTGVFLGLTNIVPIPGGKVNNDGSNILAIGRSTEARRAFWLQMKCNEQIAWGKRPRDLPEEYFAPYPQEARANAMVLSMEVMAANRQMDAMNFDEAERQMLLLMDDQYVPGIYRQLMTFDLAWLEMMNDRPGEMVARLETKEIQQFAKAMKQFPSILRTQYAVSLLRDKDEKKAEDIRVRFNRMAAQYPHESEIAGERELMELTERKAKEA
ncbi:MAG: M50 family metallopeptidase [Clostridiales bacterium]|nr:M50 family metallopeptidase [Clostridiales bacterium]